MRRPAGVVAAAVVLGLLTVIGILGATLSLVVSTVMHPPVTFPGFRFIMVGTNLIGLCFFGYCAWTVVDLFRMRRWARVSAVVIGGLLFAFSALAGVAMLAVRRFVPMIPSSGPTPVDTSTIIFFIALFYFCLSLIGLWWIVYFCLPSVRAAFNGSRLMVTNPDILPPGGAVEIPVATAGTPGWRVVIIVWACLMLFGAIGLPMVLALRTPLFLFGATLTGGAEVTFLLVMLVVQVYLGIGLIRKWKAAWYVAVLWQIYAFGYTLAFLLPGMWGKFIACEEQAAARWAPPGVPPFPLESFYRSPFMVFCFALGIALMVLFTVALFRRKEDYLGA